MQNNQLQIIATLPVILFVASCIAASVKMMLGKRNHEKWPGLSFGNNIRTMTIEALLFTIALLLAITLLPRTSSLYLLNRFLNFSDNLAVWYFQLIVYHDFILSLCSACFIAAPIYSVFAVFPNMSLVKKENHQSENNREENNNG